MTCLDNSGPIPPLDSLPCCVFGISPVYSCNINVDKEVVLFVSSPYKNRLNTKLRGLYPKMGMFAVINPETLWVQHKVSKEVGIIHINTHVAFKDLQLLWKHTADGPWNESALSFVQSQEQGWHLTQSCVRQIEWVANLWSGSGSD